MSSNVPLTPTGQAAALVQVLNSIFPSGVWDDSVEKTADRVLRYWIEFAQQPEEFEFTTFECEHDQMIVVDNIEFASVCAHHLLPFMGVAHVGYIPNGVMVGLSKIPRLVDMHARRPHTQEGLTSAIVKDLKSRLKPKGVMVVVEARHSCMACRGVRKHNGAMHTSLPVGVFLSNPSARDEFFQLVNRNKV